MSNQRTGPSQIFGVPHPPAYQQHLRDAADKQEANKIAGQRKTLQELEAKYRHLPPLVPQLPRPFYMIEGKPIYQTDQASATFYDSSREGNLDNVRAHVRTCQPPAADLAYALEEACHNFQLDVVRFLLQQPETQLHYRCFRRCPDCPDDDIAKGHRNHLSLEVSKEVSQSIFTSGHSKLLDLLKVLLEFGWHPNQLIGPPLKGKKTPLYLPRQEVPLHYPRCILDLDILRFLLDNDADPTMARGMGSEHWFNDITEKPVQRMSGAILETAVNLGAMEAVDLLISKGARPAYGMPLHSLVRRPPHISRIKVMDDAYMRELWLETPELRYPTLSTRFDMARHVLSHGEDINRVVNVYPLVGDYCQVPCRRHLATVISHAKESMDWDYVEVLLRNGAAPAVNDPTNFQPEMIYGRVVRQTEVDDMYHNVFDKAERVKAEEVE